MTNDIDSQNISAQTEKAIEIIQAEMQDLRIA